MGQTKRSKAMKLAWEKRKAREGKTKIGTTKEKPIYMHGADVPQGKYQLADIPAQISDSERIKNLENENKYLHSKVTNLRIHRNVMSSIARINAELSNIINASRDLIE